MKKSLFLLPLFAVLFLLGSTVYGQSLEFENRSNCDVTVVLTSGSCNQGCSTGTITLPARSVTEIPLPPCNIPSFFPNAFNRLTLTDGASTVSVGLACGLPSQATYTDCTGDPRTVIMVSATQAQIQ